MIFLIAPHYPKDVKSQKFGCFGKISQDFLLPECNTPLLSQGREIAKRGGLRKFFIKIFLFKRKAFSLSQGRKIAK